MVPFYKSINSGAMWFNHLSLQSGFNFSSSMAFGVQFDQTSFLKFLNFFQVKGLFNLAFGPLWCYKLQFPSYVYVVD